MNEHGQVVVGNVTEYPAQSRPEFSGSGSSSAYASDWTDENERDLDEDYAAGDFGEDGGAVESWGRSEAPILLYLHEVTKSVKSSHCIQFLNSSRLPFHCDYTCVFFLPQLDLPSSTHFWSWTCP
jgi:hypothetical protein